MGRRFLFYRQSNFEWPQLLICLECRKTFGKPAWPREKINYGVFLSLHLPVIALSCRRVQRSLHFLGRQSVVDVVDPATRSRMMSGIRARNTRPEMRLRRALHALGFRFRLHAKGLPGKPDLVLHKHGAVIFVHGCFWHRHLDCRLASTPASNREFWNDKFVSNIERDKRATEALRERGWRVATVWECCLRPKDISIVIEQTRLWLLSDDPKIELP